MAKRLRARFAALSGARWFDPALAVGLGVLCLTELAVRPGMSDSPLAPVLVLAVVAPIAVRRRFPLAATYVEAALGFPAHLLPGGFPDLSALVVGVVVYSCGAYARNRDGMVAAGVLLVVLEATIGFPDSFVPVFLDAVGPYWAGRQVGARRALVSALAERARELEAEEDAFARLAVRQERGRIARELHDIVAHHLAVIVVQAGAGRMATTSDGAAERFAAIRQSGGQVLDEMDRLLEILHAEDRGDGVRADRWRVLVEQAGAGGLSVRIDQLPREVRLPARVEDVAFRLVQEGLTNAIKHAPGADVSVRLAVRDGALELEVSDGGGKAAPTLAPTGSGLGLQGMQERVESTGGVLDAGPADGGGWSLRAQLPLVEAFATPAR